MLYAMERQGTARERLPTQNCRLFLAHRNASYHVSNSDQQFTWRDGWQFLKAVIAGMGRIQRVGFGICFRGKDYPRTLFSKGTAINLDMESIG